MLTIWIVHRLGAQRAAIARIAGSADSSVLGAPGDAIFESAAPAEIVVLGLSEDFEAELEFAHRVGSRLPNCRWILLAAESELPEARRLFDTLPADFLPFPPTPASLRGAIRSALRDRDVHPLSQRRRSDAISRRSSRWFADLESPEMLQAMDPRMARVPTLTLGEEGTGRGLFALYAHAHGGSRNDAFVHIPCTGLATPAAFLTQLDQSTPARRRAGWTIWLEDVDDLPVAMQSRVQNWIEYGLPEAARAASRIRWIASARDSTSEQGSALERAPTRPGILPGLAQALSGLRVQIPPLRSRIHCVEAFVADTALAWCNERGEALRSFSPEAIALLREYPWPGNLRELEAVVTRTLSRSGADPILPTHLRFEGLESRPRFEIDAERHLPEAEILPEFEEALGALPGGREVAAGAATDPREAKGSDVQRGVPPDSSLAETLECDVSSPISELPARDGALAQSPLDWPRMVRAVAHEIRNPLVSIRTFAELLPERFGEAEFRERFVELVGEDVRRIEEVVTRLMTLTDDAETETGPVDMAALLDDLLDERRGEIQARRLLVLKELDREHPLAIVDVGRLRDALAGVLSKALSLVPDHGDVYIASRHRASGLRGQPMLRLLLRYSHRAAPSLNHSGERAVAEGMALSETSLEVVIADKVVSAIGGSLTVDASEGQETVIIIDLPAPTH